MRRTAGFTLIEMLIVLAVLGAVIGVVISHGPPRSQALQTRAAAGALAGMLRAARATAIAKDADVTVAIDAKHHSFAGDGGTVRMLDPAIDITVLPPTLPGPEGVRLIRFSGDGSATGGTVLLGRGHAQLRIEVEWLTGRVKVANAR